jgi:hypothetical protein
MFTDNICGIYKPVGVSVIVLVGTLREIDVFETMREVFLGRETLMGYLVF